VERKMLLISMREGIALLVANLLILVWIG
jgi:hypothetical protein